MRPSPVGGGRGSGGGAAAGAAPGEGVAGELHWLQ